jgi:hypothetical protein
MTQRADRRRKGDVGSNPTPWGHLTRQDLQNMIFKGDPPGDMRAYKPKEKAMPQEYHDYPLEEIAKAFDEHSKKGAQCFQKWTCAHCGARQTMPNPNVLYTHGNCEECQKQTDIRIKGCNYLYTMSTTHPDKVLGDILKGLRGRKP